MRAQEISKALADAGLKFAIAVTGGGAEGITELLRVGGASAWLEDFQVPYGKAASRRMVPAHLGYPAVSEEFAKHLAGYMWTVNFGHRWSTSTCRNPKCLGVGVTSKLTYDGERQGQEHLVWAALHTYNQVQTYTLVPKGKTREQQEEEVGEFIQQLLLRQINREETS